MKRLVYSVLCIVCCCLAAQSVMAQEYVPQFGHSLEVDALAASPDGKWIASGDVLGRLLLWQTDNGMIVRDLTPVATPTGQPAILDPKAELPASESTEVVGGPDQGITRLTFLRDGTALVVADKLGRVGVVPVDGTAIRAGQGLGQAVVGLFASASNGAVMVTKSTVAWGVEAAEASTGGTCPRDNVTYSSAAISPDGTQLAIGGEDGNVFIWAIGTCGADSFKSLSVPAGPAVRAIAWLTNGQGLVVGHENGRLDIVDIATPENIRRVESTARGPLAIASSADGKTVAVGYEDGKLRKFSLESGLQVDSSDPGAGAIPALAFNSTNGDLFGATTTGALYRWPGADKMGAGTVLGVPNAASYFGMFSPDGKRVIVFPRNSTVEGTLPLHNWNLAAMKVSKTPELPSSMLIWGRWTGTGERVFFRENSGGHVVWDLSNNVQVLWWGMEYSQRVLQALSPDGKQCLVGEDRSVALYSAKQKADTPLKSVDLTEWVNYADFSADGSRVLVGSDSGITLFEGTKLKRLWGCNDEAILWPHGSQLMAMDLAESGLKAATCGVEGSVALWDLKAKSLTAKFVPGGFACWALSFASSDKKLLIGTTDGRVAIWDLEKKAILKTFKVADGIIDDLTISSDGKQLRVVSSDGTIYVVDPETGARIHTIYRNEAGEWLVLGSAGVVDASPNGKSLVGVRKDGVVSPLK